MKFGGSISQRFGRESRKRSLGALEPCNGERRGALVAESWKMGEVTVGGDEGEDKIPPQPQRSF